MSKSKRKYELKKQKAGFPQMESLNAASIISGVSLHALKKMIENGDVVTVRYTDHRVLVNMDSLMNFLNTGEGAGADD